MEASKAQNWAVQPQKKKLPKGESVRKHSKPRVATAESKEWTKRALTFRS
jgi:hypothetical protein